MHLENFIKTIKTRGRAKKTLVTIEQCLLKPEMWLGKPLEDATFEELMNYIDFIKENGSPSQDPNAQKKSRKIGAGSQFIIVSKLIQFYSYCFDETDDIKYNKMVRRLKKIRPSKPKTHVTASDILLPHEAKRLINAAGTERDKCIVAVFWEGGLRIGELFMLTNEMVKIDDNLQEVLFEIPNLEGCKTGARAVLCADIYNYVVEWLKCSPDTSPKAQFIHLSYNGIRKVIKRLYTKAGINKPCFVHILRHSAITNAVNQGLDSIKLSMRFWGIPESHMVSTYVHLNSTMNAAGYRNARGIGSTEVVDTLSKRCACGRLTDETSGVCKQCAESKKLQENYNDLKKQIDTMREWIEGENRKQEVK